MNLYSRTVPLALFGGCLVLFVLTAASMLSDPEPPGSDPVAVAVPDETDQDQKIEDCYGALGYFSGDRENARYVIWRESRNDPSAQNPRSTAAGCFQLIERHAWRFDEVGCSWSRRYEPVCNTLAADHLFREAGWA
ncbi:MAG: transglycosylase SLT domain-containing protein, partial [Microthrixaceae bacterium]